MASEGKVIPIHADGREPKVEGEGGEDRGDKRLTLEEVLRDLSALSIEAVVAEKMPRLPSDADIVSAFEARVKSRDRARLALVMIVRDAEREFLGVDSKGNLSIGTLSRIAGEVWDFVVVDTGSRDRTPVLAAELGARVYPFSWRQDFAAARNFAISKVRPGARFILHLDADEVVSREFVARLNAILEDAPDNRCLSVPLELRNAEGNGIEGGITMQLRVFPTFPDENGVPRVRYEGAIHEQIRFSLDRLGAEEDVLSGDPGMRIVHTGYADPDRTKLKCVRNREILETEMTNPERKRAEYEIRWHLSKCEAALGHVHVALDHVMKVALDPECRVASKWLAKSAFRWWGELLSRDGSPVLAIRVWEEAEKLFPEDPLFSALIGLHLAILGDRDGAIARLKAASGRDFPISALDVPVQEIRRSVAERLAQLIREKAFEPETTDEDRMRLLTEANGWEAEALSALSSRTSVRPT
jgi:hypothetical protein